MDKAKKLFHRRIDYTDNYILEGVIWELPKPVLGSDHPYKYRLFYGCEGRRIIGYDNERGKGDHRHYDNREELYNFINPKQLLEDFLTDVEIFRDKL